MNYGQRAGKDHRGDQSPESQWCWSKLRLIRNDRAQLIVGEKVTM